jgi:cytochrome P450
MRGGKPEVDALFDAAVVQDPTDYYRQLRATDPVHEVVDGTFLVTGMDLVREVVANTDIFSSRAINFLHHGDWPRPGLRPLIPDGLGVSDDIPGVLATADPPDHGRQRKVLSKHFTADRMRAMEPAFRVLVTDALSDVGPDGRLDWMSQVAEPLPMVMVARILGLPDAHAAELKKIGYAMVERIGGFVSEDRIDQLEAEDVNNLAPVLDAYTHARQGAPADANGIIATVAQAVGDGELDDTEAIGIITMLIAAGGESTTSLTGTAARILAERVELQDRLRADPTLVPTFIEEALRYDPPFRGHYRVVTRDTVLGDTKLPAGTHVVLAWPAANRDEAAFEHPDEVRLDRNNPRAHVGFGWGIHLCIGAPLARVEAKVAIETLLARTARFHIDDQQPLPYHPSLLVRRLVSLPLVLEPAR